MRAQLEKRGLMDALRNQIIERKVIDLVLANASFKDVPYRAEESDVEALDRRPAGGEQSEIPEAKPGGKPTDRRARGRTAAKSTGETVA